MSATTPDLRIRLFGRLLGMSGLTSPDTMSRRQIALSRALPIPHGPGLDLVVGGLGSGVRMEQRQVTVRDGDRIGVRVYRSSASGMLPLVVNFHGGGWVLGSLAMAESVCSRLAAALPAVVASVDYRLAPEHRFPTALHDAYDATVWAHANADEFGADASTLAVMGDSAGGNLAAGVALLARGNGPRIGAQELLYPALDLTLGSPSMAENAHAPVLTRSHMRAYRDHYLGPRGDPEDPLASPLLADDLSGLPPALIQTAQFDPLRDDGARYAARLVDAGVPVSHTCLDGTAHGFATFPGVFRRAPQAFEQLVGHLREHLEQV
ncbi:MAG: putative lipase [Pseudonocardia sp.]|nr:putative lipase [Pseudonocardia sp.]